MNNDTEMDDVSFDEFRDIKPVNRRKPLTLVILLLLILVLVGAGAYAYLNGMLPLPGAAQPVGESGPESEATPTGAEPTTTAVQGAATEKIEATRTATTGQEESPTATEPPAEPEDFAVLLNPPEFGKVVFNRASADGEWSDKADRLAADMAIAEPYNWEYLEFDAATRVKDVRNYYVRVLNREMGYRMTFDETYQGGITVMKFKLEGRRVTIQFWEGQPKAIPYALVFYEGW